MARQPVPRNVPHRVGSAKARVAVYTRDHRPPEQIEAARAELAERGAPISEVFHEARLGARFLPEQATGREAGPASGRMTSSER